MDTHQRSPRLGRPEWPGVARRRSPLRHRFLVLLAFVTLSAALTALTGGCARVSKLSFVNPVVPVVPQEVTASQDSSERRGEDRENETRPSEPMRAMFADTLIGFQSGTADSAKRYLGRLRNGYTADTLNLILLGDNRPSYRSSKFGTQATAIKNIMTLNPLNWIKGLVSIPILLVRGTIPDFALWRDIPSFVRYAPTYGREVQVMNAVIARVDSLQARGKEVAAVINTGDLVNDGRVAGHWARFLKIQKPLYSRVPYLPIAGNHERTDDSTGLMNWSTATGLPIKGNLLHYCFDSADGWVRFIALDSNPMTDTKQMWSREDEVAATNEQFTWMIARLKEHTGPALVFLHHPPFSVGFHRSEWEADSLLSARRLQMVNVLRENGLSLLVGGHEHGYERALLTSGDAVLVCIVTGGAGAPLHQIEAEPQAGASFAAYKVDSSLFKPENTFTSMSYHYILLRLWFGGGDLRTFAVDAQSKDTEIDQVEVNLKRFGIPQVDQKKMPVPPKSGPSQPAPAEERNPNRQVASPDSTRAVKPVTKASSKPQPAPKKPAPKPAPKPAARPDTTKTGP
jgi:hypothetical protein